MKIAVSGINGFVGQHLALELSEHGHEIVGLGVGAPAAPIRDSLDDYHDVDLTKTWPATGASAVIHLAALSEVGPSFADPQRYIHANTAPTTHLFEMAARQPGQRLIIISSGAVYGNHGHAPSAEEDRPAPASPYAMTKLFTEVQADYYRRRGVDSVVFRPFNHLGPGQRQGFILTDLLAGVRRWKSDGVPLVVGNLATRRDYTDVRDVVRAYRLAAEAPWPLPSIMNVCSGVARSGWELLQMISELLDLELPPVEEDPKLFRPNDAPTLVGSNRLIQDTLGWTPRLSLQQTVNDLIATEAGPDRAP